MNGFLFSNITFSSK